MSDAIVVAIIACLPGLVAAWLSYKGNRSVNQVREGVKEVHVIVNSQKDALLAEIAGLKEALKKEKGEIK